MNADERRSCYDYFIRISPQIDTCKNAPTQPSPYPCAYDVHLSSRKVRTLEPSESGEFEITDVNNEYIRQGAMGYRVLDGCRSDAGYFDSLLRAGVMVERYRETQNHYPEKT